MSDGDVTRPSPRPAGLPRIPGVTLQHEIARGGMGVVYRGRQDYLDRPVAVKLLAAELAGESFVQRFQREAKILAGIKHPNIVACHQAGQTDEGQSFLVMEFIDGPSLKRWIADNGPAAPAVALGVVRAVAQALAHAHRSGIIHRDVKAENILLERAPQASTTFPFVPKVVDLGLARTSEGSASIGLTSPGSVMGTPATMSPEQFDEPEAVDFRSDIYGLGCVLFELLVGKPAFPSAKLTELIEQKRSAKAPDPRARDASIPPDVAELTQWLLARDRDARPRSYEELDDRLGALLAPGSNALTRPSPRPARPTQADDPDAGLGPTRVHAATGAARGAGTGALRRRLPFALAAAAALVAGFWLARGEEPAGGGANAGGTAGGSDSRDKVVATANQPPTDVRIDGPTEAKLDVPLTLTASARDPEGAPLTYSWEYDESLVSVRGRTDGPIVKVQLEDGLPGVEIPITVTVRDASSLVASTQHKLVVGDVPAKRILRGFNKPDSGWQLDRSDIAWSPANDDPDGAACLAKGELRRATYVLADEAYWEWSGALDVEEADGSAMATVTAAFLWGDRGYGIACSRSEDGSKWRTSAVELTSAGDGFLVKPFDPPIASDDVEPPADAPDADLDPLGWFRVRRSGDQLVLQVGTARRQLDGRIKEAPGPTRTLAAPKGDCRVQLCVDKGIGRFYLQTR